MDARLQHLILHIKTVDIRFTNVFFFSKLRKAFINHTFFKIKCRLWEIHHGLCSYAHKNPLYPAIMSPLKNEDNKCSFYEPCNNIKTII